MSHPGRVVLLMLGCCLAGCGHPTQPAPPAGPSEVTVHGVIEWTPPGTTGPQAEPVPHFLRVDDGRYLGLALSPEFSVLGDQANDGRGITVTGRLGTTTVEPIGPVWTMIAVSSYRFDSP